MAVVFCLRTIGTGSNVYFILTVSDSARLLQNKSKNIPGKLFHRPLVDWNWAIQTSCIA